MLILVGVVGVDDVIRKFNTVGVGLTFMLLSLAFSSSVEITPLLVVEAYGVLIFICHF